MGYKRRALSLPFLFPRGVAHFSCISPGLVPTQLPTSSAPIESVDLVGVSSLATVIKTGLNKDLLFSHAKILLLHDSIDPSLRLTTSHIDSNDPG